MQCTDSACLHALFCILQSLWQPRAPVPCSMMVQPLCERNKIQNNDTEHKDTEHKETELKEAQHKDTQHKDTQHKVTQHKDTQHKDTQHKDTQHKDTQHKGAQHNGQRISITNITSITKRKMREPSITTFNTLAQNSYTECRNAVWTLIHKKTIFLALHPLL